MTPSIVRPCDDPVNRRYYNDARMLRVTLLPLLCAALSACAASSAGDRTAPAQPLAEQVVLTPEATGPRYPTRPRKPPEWFQGVILAAEEDLMRGRVREALERVYAAQSQKPDRATRRRLADVVRRCNERVLQLETVRGAFVSEKEAIVFGEPVRLRVRFRNHGLKPVRIPARVEGTTGSVLVIDVVRREYDVRAQVVTTRSRLYRPLREDLELESGGVSEMVLEIGMHGNDRPLEGYRTYTVNGLLRPAVLEVDGLRRWDPVRLRSTTLHSFRARYEHLKDDPLARIRQAIEKNALVHLLTASALVAPAQRRDAVDTLVAALRGGRPVDWAIFAALQGLTEVELGRDPAAWRAWWPRVRETYFDELKPRAATDEPVFAQD
jgi:hypothetical protein